MLLEKAESINTVCISAMLMAAKETRLYGFIKIMIYKGRKRKKWADF